MAFTLHGANMKVKECGHGNGRANDLQSMNIKDMCVQGDRSATDRQPNGTFVTGDIYETNRTGKYDISSQ